MYNAYSKTVDTRSRKAMAEFLSKHFRYNTANSWNGSTSWANNMKIYNINTTSEIKNKLYDLLDCDSNELSWAFDDLITDFERETGYTAGFNGRSGGYLVMYDVEWKPSGYKSFCTNCGQQNYKSIEESGCKCGRCGSNSRINYKKEPMQKVVYTGRSVDNYDYEEYMDKDEFSMDELKEKVKLIQRFDELCNDIIATAIQYATDYEVVEEEIFVPKTVKVLKEVIS